jgi:hypothetical protein
VILPLPKGFPVDAFGNDKLECFTRDSLLKGKVQLTSMYQLILDLLPFIFQKNIYIFYKKSTLLRRSTVLSLPLQLAFPGLIQVS